MPDAVFSEDLKTAEQWQEIEQVRVVNPDGWRGDNARPWDEKISYTEWCWRRDRSTIRS